MTCVTHVVKGIITVRFPDVKGRWPRVGFAILHWALWKKRGDPLAPRLSAPYWTPESRSETVRLDPLLPAEESETGWARARLPNWPCYLEAVGFRL